jgi:hypothetical protein
VLAESAASDLRSVGVVKALAVQWFRLLSTYAVIVNSLALRLSWLFRLSGIRPLPLVFSTAFITVGRYKQNMTAKSWSMPYILGNI